MATLTLNMACRYAGGVFAYTCVQSRSKVLILLSTSADRRLTLLSGPASPSARSLMVSSAPTVENARRVADFPFSPLPCFVSLLASSLQICTNAMSPPELVNVANGLSQSAASLARVIGPILGGALWSVSIAENTISMGFNVVAV